jgi:hypothetical protein
MDEGHGGTWSEAKLLQLLRHMRVSRFHQLHVHLRTCMMQA